MDPGGGCTSSVSVVRERCAFDDVGVDDDAWVGPEIREVREPIEYRIDRVGVAAGTERLGSTRNAEGRGRAILTSGKWRRRPRGRWSVSFRQRTRRRSRNMPAGVSGCREQSRAENMWTHRAHPFPCAWIGWNLATGRPSGLTSSGTSENGSRRARATPTGEAEADVKGLLRPRPGGRKRNSSP
jgi:hypothetical protein